MKMSRKLCTAKLFLHIGDVCSEIELLDDGIEELYSWLPDYPVSIERDFLGNHYFSKPLPLPVKGVVKKCSGAGDICYFPWSRALAITIKDEELSCGIPRIKIGRFKQDLLRLQSLTAVEHIRFIWRFQSRPNLREKG